MKSFRTESSGFLHYWQGLWVLSDFLFHAKLNTTRSNELGKSARATLHSRHFPKSTFLQNTKQNMKLTVKLREMWCISITPVTICIFHGSPTVVIILFIRSCGCFASVFRLSSCIYATKYFNNHQTSGYGYFFLLRHLILAWNIYICG